MSSLLDWGGGCGGDDFHVLHGMARHGRDSS